ncbi:AAA-like domain-containing protein [Lamprobacter modestohalophilus]|uniref:AAA-like domain-containing protein n=1 Tax=Lamprobacter modestohalophilus TaxID=1064514 RepID=UPI002ADEB53B|nr:AAA-like domain-containing protein [Lamprobacter modestohalophilus]MEA1050575.1 AAA-like domain-containing protein [Lamprobacter modestohalophilus]
MRFFNTEGPVRAGEHYLLPPLTRWDLEQVLSLIEQKKYFLLHAPRQTGKTSCLLALMAYLNQQDRYRALYVNIESAQSAREQVEQGMAIVCSALGRAAKLYLDDARPSDWCRTEGREIAAGDRFAALLEYWAGADSQPLVLLLDEVDALVGDTLVALLRQLRAGYPQRPQAFPNTVILCGVRDLRDYRIHARSEPAPITGGSAFNIKAESLRLGDFSEAETQTLLQEHTQETGQVFTPEALQQVWTLTQGQPWLVNALAYQACFRSPQGRDRTRAIDAAMIDAAKESLILNRVTHLDQLADKLCEERVRRIIEPMLAGEALEQLPLSDIEYLTDLGLLRQRGGGGIEIANPIYREVLPRTLALVPQASLPQISPTWLDDQGQLDPERLLAAFLEFWRQHGEPLLKSAPYHEIAPHLVLMAFLHRVVNGGGTLEREYAIGAGRMDLCLRYGAVALGIELKVWRDGRPDPLARGLEQLDGYLSGLRLDSGWLVLFDRRNGQPPIAERTQVDETRSPGGRRIQVIRA